MNVKKIIALFVLLAASIAQASFVNFYFTNWNATVTADTPFQVFPISLNTNGTYIVIGLPQRISATNGISENNQFMPGSYQLKFVNAKNQNLFTSTFLFTVPADTNTYNVIDIRAASAMQSEGAAYTQSASDSRYISKTNSTGTNGNALILMNGVWTSLPIPSSSSTNGGTVTSVGIVPTAEFTASTAITGSGNITLSKVAQPANTFWMGPTNSSGVPTFRLPLASEIPALPYTGTNTFATNNIAMSAAIVSVSNTVAYASQWSMWIDANTNYLAQNNARSILWSSNSFDGLLQRVANADGAFIKVAANDYYTNRYIFSNTVIVTNWLIIEGEGNPSTVFRADSTLDGPMIQVGTSTSQSGGVNLFSRIRFEGSDGGTNCSGVFLVGCSEPNFNFCEFNQFPAGGIIFSNKNANHWSQIQNCWFVPSYSSTNGAGVVLKVPPGYVNDNIELQINNCFFQSGQSDGIRVVDDFRNLSVIGCRFSALPVATQARAIRIQNGENFNISHNFFRDYRNSAMPDPIVFEPRSSPTNISAVLMGNYVNYTKNLGSGASNIVDIGANNLGITLIGNINPYGKTATGQDAGDILIDLTNSVLKSLAVINLSTNTLVGTSANGNDFISITPGTGLSLSGGILSATGGGGSGSGESNTISSASNSGASLIADTSKVGADLRLKSLSVSSDFGVTTNATNISLTLDSGITRDSELTAAITSATNFPNGLLATNGSGVILSVDSTAGSVTINDGIFSSIKTDPQNAVLVTDGSGTVSASSTTPTELNYLSGATNNIQSQINTNTANIADKANSANPEFTGTIKWLSAGDTVSRIAYLNYDGVDFLLDYFPDVTTNEVAQLAGVTGNVQTNFTAMTASLAAKQTGDSKLSNIVALANSAGVLTNNGSGTLSWVPISSGGAGGPTPSNNIPVNLAFTGTNTLVDASLGTVFRLRLTNNVGITITNGVDGQAVTLQLTQDATGNRTAYLTNQFQFGDTITGITLSTNAGKTDYIRAQYWATSNRWDVLGYSRGF